MRKLVVVVLFGLGTCLVASASASLAEVPEIDPASGASVLALIAAAVIAYRARRKD